MARSFVTVPKKQLARGIDAYSALTNIPDGYSSELQNVDVNASGKIEKRRGYEGYYGRVPVRISNIEHDGTDIIFELDTGVDLSSAKPGPIVVAGKLSSSQSGDWTDSDNAEYYESFTINDRNLLTSPSGILSKPQSSHGVESSNLFIGLAESLNAANTDNASVIPDEIRIDDTSYDVDIDYAISSSTNGFFYFSDKQADPGNVYVKTGLAAVTSTTILVGEHNLNNFNIIVKAYDTSVNAGKSTEIIPSDITIDTSGNVTVEFDVAFTGKVILSAAPVSNVLTELASVGTNTITIPNSPAPFIFVGAYKFNSATSEFESVIVNSIEYDTATNSHTITYTVAALAENVDIYYEAASFVSNQLKVTDNGAISATYTDESPQLTLWGLNHSEIYQGSASRGGHVNHIDHYARVGENRLIAGLGGNLYAARTRSESGASFLIPFATIRMQIRTDGDRCLYPLFATTGDTTVRTRGLVTDASVSEHKARVTAATFVSSGVVDYTLSFTSKTGSVVLGTEVSTNDFLTVTNMPHSLLNGKFKISSIVSDSSTETVVRVANSSIINDTTDTSGTEGRAGVFSDLFVLESTSIFLTTDTLNLGSATPSVDSIDGINVYVDLSDVSGRMIAVPDGLLVKPTRTASVFPLAANNDNFVRGDIVSLESGVTDRSLRIVGSNPTADESVSISVSSGIATVTTAAANNYTVGDKFILLADSNFIGEHSVTSRTSSTSFTFTTSAADGGYTATLLGNTVEFDEEITIGSEIQCSVIGRWIPIEAPDNTGDLPETTYFTHFDTSNYTSQPILRSVMAGDNMYFTNQEDEVQKFDGENVYRASLPRWQPRLFGKINTAGSSILEGYTIAYTSSSGTGQSVNVASNPALSAGSRVFISGTGGGTFTVSEVRLVPGSPDTYDIVFTKDSGATGLSGAGNLTLVNEYKFYARLNMVDANNNIIGTAATGSQDMVLDQAESCTFHIRLGGFPVFDNYDYDRIEVELYRTRANEAGPFYRVARELMNFNSGDGYIDIVDGLEDDALLDLDPVHSTLEGQELGTAWQQMPRAKHITTASNRLLLANVKGYPELDLVARLKNGSTGSAVGDYAGVTFTFRRDNTESGSVTDMTNTAVYEMVNSGDEAVTLSSETTTSVTLTVGGGGAPAGLAVGDWVYLFHKASTGDKRLTYAGWWQLSGVSGNDITFNYPHTESFGATDINRVSFATDPTNIPVYIPGDDDNYEWREGNDTVNLEKLVTDRLALAINSTMRMVDSSVNSLFVPWLAANSGSDFQNGQMRIFLPNGASTTPEVVLAGIPATPTYDIFINDLQRANAEQISMITRVFPSRLLRSFPNFAEIFDNPLAISEVDSRSAIDIDSDDGQEITAIIPFFGASTFRSGQLNQAVVVFKSNSIHLVDVESGDVQKIDSRGLGCTIPRSVCSTRRGIMFANESGIYRLDTDMNISYIGKYLEDRWFNSVNRDKLEEITGHNDSIRRSYKLSYPAGSSSFNNNVFTYFHDLEQQGQEYGAWTNYTNHAATGWTTQEDDSFFSTTDGNVFRRRDANASHDYRDDASAVAEMVVKFRPDDFGLPFVRKYIRSFATQLELDTDVTNLTVQASMNLNNTFQEAGTFTVDKDAQDFTSITFSSTFAKQKGNYVQLRYSHSTKDEAVVITGLSYNVARLSTKGIDENADFGGTS